jgi:tRNA(fMet)-specific endonuclease VapC
MSLFLLDTDTLSLVEQGHPTVLQRVNSHRVADIALCAISIQEQMQGWQAALNRARNPQQVAQA